MRFYKIPCGLFFLSLLLLNLDNMVSAKERSIRCLKEIHYFDSESSFVEVLKCDHIPNTFDSLYSDFYSAGFTYEQSLRKRNQILNLLGISFKKTSSIFSFPEQRIDHDARLFWKSYLRLQDEQFTDFSFHSSDIQNGYNSSIGE